MKSISIRCDKRWVNLIRNNQCWILLIALFMLSCARTPLPEPVTVRFDRADQMAARSNWSYHLLNTSPFKLATYLPDEMVVSDQLTVYIEGDGVAWESSRVKSNNATPSNPVALGLALKQPDGLGNAAYVARPCQFVIENQWGSCVQRDWTDARFSEAIVTSVDEAVNQLKARFHAEQITLVGYSGGGAIAALVAARRNDVILLITVAGNLDIQKWRKIHYLPQWYLSTTVNLNPVDYVDKLQNIRQVHFVGANDSQVSLPVAQSYVEYFPPNKKPKIDIIKDFTHECCWVEQWDLLWKKATNQQSFF